MEELVEDFTLVLDPEVDEALKSVWFGGNGAEVTDLPIRRSVGRSQL